MRQVLGPHLVEVEGYGDPEQRAREKILDQSWDLVSIIVTAKESTGKQEADRSTCLFFFLTMIGKSCQVLLP
jgi:hypothetical protein